VIAKRCTGAKVEGRKSIAETKPETVELARKLARARPKGGKRSIREISAALAEAGHVTRSGKLYAPTAVKLMIERGRVVGRDDSQHTPQRPRGSLGGL
jgi:hypothetical protein